MSGNSTVYDAMLEEAPLREHVGGAGQVSGGDADVERQSQMQGELLSGLEESGCPPWNLPSDPLHAPNALKMHVIACLAVSFASFVVWLVVGIYVTALPWFIYVVGIATISLAVHYYLFERPREWLQLHIIVFCVLCSEGLITWLHQNTNSLWVVYLPLALLFPLTVHLIVGHLFRGRPNRWLYSHFSLFCIASIVGFIAWVDVGRGFPWWIYVVLGQLPLLFLHYRYVYGMSLLALHASMFMLTILSVFFTWVYLRSRFPWWLFVVVGWGFVLYVHYSRFRYCGESHREITSSSAPLPPIPPLVIHPPLGQVAIPGTITSDGEQRGNSTDSALSSDGEVEESPKFTVPAAVEVPELDKQQSGAITNL